MDQQYINTTCGVTGTSFGLEDENTITLNKHQYDFQNDLKLSTCQQDEIITHQKGYDDNTLRVKTMSDIQTSSAKFEKSQIKLNDEYNQESLRLEDNEYGPYKRARLDTQNQEQQDKIQSCNSYKNSDGKQGVKRKSKQLSKNSQQNCSNQSNNSNCSNSNETDGEEEESDEKKYKRLIQNRKSAQKCRMKKKAEFHLMKDEIEQIKTENTSLKDKLNEITIMLYNKIEENQFLTKKMDQNQTHHTMFLTKLLLNWHQGGNISVNSLQSQIQNHLITCIDNNLNSRFVSSIQQKKLEQNKTSNDQVNLNNMIQSYLQKQNSSAHTDGATKIMKDDLLIGEKSFSHNHVDNRITNPSTPTPSQIQGLDTNQYNGYRPSIEIENNKQALSTNTSSKYSPMIGSTTQKLGTNQDIQRSVLINSNQAGTTSSKVYNQQIGELFQKVELQRQLNRGQLKNQYN